MGRPVVYIKESPLTWRAWTITVLLGLVLAANACVLSLSIRFQSDAWRDLGELAWFISILATPGASLAIGAAALRLRHAAQLGIVLAGVVLIGPVLMATLSGLLYGTTQFEAGWLSASASAGIFVEDALRNTVFGYAAPVIASMIFLVIGHLSRRGVLRVEVYNDHRCHRCGYERPDLPICPECGAPSGYVAEPWPGPLRTLWRWSLIPLALLLIALTLTLVITPTLVD